MSSPIRVAIQGVAGCFHDDAAREFFGPDTSIDTVPCNTFHELFDTLHADERMLGIVAIENTIAGSLLQNHELLRQSDLFIIGEHKKYISHCLCALPGQTVDNIAEVNSHPMALMQCEQFLLAHPAMKVVETSDTAGSAKWIAERHLQGHAAICGSLAAKLYGLDILADDIQTNKRNFTRFLVLASRRRAPELTDSRPVDKASLAFTLPHSHGSLSAVLTIFSFYGMNLTKIQSLPIIGHEWEYRFYIDLTFDDHTRYRQSVAAVMPLLSDFKILGEYRAHQQDAVSTER